MTLTLPLLFSFTIAIAAIIGALRFKKIDRSYYPFIYLCWIAFFAEVVALIVNTLTRGSQIPSNLYVLIEALLLTWQFRLWGSFERRRNLYPVLMYSFLIVWMIDNFIINKTIHHASSYCRIVFALSMVILTIDQINRMIVRERKVFLTYSKFIICMAIIIYFSYKIVIETFYIYAAIQKSTPAFIDSILAIHNYVNLFTNLIYAYAILWAPKKKAMFFSLS